MAGAGSQWVAELLCRTDELFLPPALLRTAPLDLDARPAATIPKGSHIVGRHAKAHCDLLAEVDNPTPMAGCTAHRHARRRNPRGGAGCVNALVRICAGGPGRLGSLPRSDVMFVERRRPTVGRFSNPWRSEGAEIKAPISTQDPRRGIYRTAKISLGRKRWSKPVLHALFGSLDCFKAESTVESAPDSSGPQTVGRSQQESLVRENRTLGLRRRGLET